MKLYINTENENVEPEAEIHETRGIIWGTRKLWKRNDETSLNRIFL